MPRDNPPDPEIDSAALAAWLRQPAAPVLIDVREPAEQAGGCLADALLLPESAISAHIAALVPDQAADLVVYCAGGVRSLAVARTLVAMGYRKVQSLRGGFRAWQQAGYPWVVPAMDGRPAPLGKDQALRYARHLRLPEIGVQGQARLLASRVLCIGAGGLGSPACLYLAAAGVGTLGIVDSDVVELSNLQRQVVHSGDRIGMRKVDSAALTLGGLNTDVRLIRHADRLTADNALEVMAAYDVVVDGSDNFATRYLVNDAALRLHKPVVHAALQGFQGQVTVFAAGGAPCYRCLFPSPPPADAAPSCEEAGVLGVVPGLLGTIQATEALKLLLGIGTSLAGRLLTYDALTLRFDELRFRPDPHCRTCSNDVNRAEIPLARA